MLWLLWVGRARHPGPFSGSMTVEVFNVGGWLTHGDLSIEVFQCGRLAYSWGYGVGDPC